MEKRGKARRRSGQPDGPAPHSGEPQKTRGHGLWPLEPRVWPDRWRRLEAKVQAEWQRLIQAVPWQLVFTVTYPYEKVSSELAVGVYARWINGAASRVQAPIEWMVFPELTYSDRYHLHGFLYCRRELPVAAMKKAWREKVGHQVRIDPYDPRQSMASYVTKQITLDHSEVQWSRGLPALLDEFGFER